MKIPFALNSNNQMGIDVENLVLLGSQLALDERDSTLDIYTLWKCLSIGFGTQLSSTKKWTAGRLTANS